MERIVGTPVPSVRMPCSDGGELDLAQLATSPLIAYLYPGDDQQTTGSSEAASGRREASAAPSSCAVQRAGFREYALDFAALGVKVVGISSEPHHAQRSIALAERLPFPLLSDVDCVLADVLPLPTLAERESRRYRRVTLICGQGGAIKAVFYPVSPKRSAMQALSWLEYARRD